MKKYILLLIIPFLSFGQTTDSFLPICNIDMKTDFSGDNVSMSIQELKVSRGLYVSKHPQSLEDASFLVHSYSIRYTDDTGAIQEIGPIKDNKFTPNVQKVLRTRKSGSLISFFDIKAQKMIKGKVMEGLISIKPMNITIE